MKEFLEKRIPQNPGDILDTLGNVIWKHNGAFSYTIGQRKGIEIGGWPALFVVAKDTRKNTITVGTGEELELYSKHCSLTDWVGETPEEDKKYGAKIRYRQEDQEVIVTRNSWLEIDKNSDRLTIYDLRFTNAQRAITPGQIAVIYDDIRVVGSGIIIE